MSPDTEPPDPVAVRRREARENAEYHYAAAARAAEAEARKTAPMVAAFAEAMRSAGIEPTRLRALPYSGGGTLRTDVVGWYVKRDHRAAVGTDGRWYVLVVAPSLRGRLAGVHVEPSDAPLQVGAGGRDGDSLALDVLLQLRLDGFAQAGRGLGQVQQRGEHAAERVDAPALVRDRVNDDGDLFLNIHDGIPQDVCIGRRS